MIVKKAASLYLTAFAILLLVVTIGVAYMGAFINKQWIILPITLLVINLLAALIFNPRFRRQSGLLMFHVCLLLVMMITSVSILMYFEGRVELVVGNRFEASDVMVQEQGILHRQAMEEITFTQGEVEVEYGPALARKAIRSTITIYDKTDNQHNVTLSENHAYIDNGYRFSVTSNKGYAVRLSWTNDMGESITGYVHMPSYPLLEWNQTNQWQTPAGQLIGLTLFLQKPIPLERNWIFRYEQEQYKLNITTDNESFTLIEGDVLQLRGGKLKFEGVQLWIGYRIDYNPVLPWLFSAAMLGVLGLGWHYIHKFRQNSIFHKDVLASRRF